MWLFTYGGSGNGGSCSGGSVVVVVGEVTT